MFIITKITKEKKRAEIDRMISLMKKASLYSSIEETEISMSANKANVKNVDENFDDFDQYVESLSHQMKNFQN